VGGGRVDWAGRSFSAHACVQQQTCVLPATLVLSTYKLVDQPTAHPKYTPRQPTTTNKQRQENRKTHLKCVFSRHSLHCTNIILVPERCQVPATACTNWHRHQPHQTPQDYELVHLSQSVPFTCVWFRNRCILVHTKASRGKLCGAAISTLKQARYIADSASEHRANLECRTSVEETP
jgi:hypothetical protein